MSKDGYYKNIPRISTKSNIHYIESSKEYVYYVHFIQNSTQFHARECVTRI